MTDKTTLTESGELEYGVAFNGELHYDFEMGLSTMAQTYQALDATEAACGTTEGTKADLYYRMALMVFSLRRLGTIPPEALTPELLLDELTAEDYDRLLDATIAVKKKRQRTKNAAPDSGSPSSPSDTTA
ncbi:hypothetical protein DS544_18855 [Salmonella enterica subsp. enterica serovar Abony]|nr:hypothetical protein [Salmonella enterica subsp. enterica serovar Abony]ECK0367434.1 hypothetical protein [Salmonella enterica subsp. enterica serovar Abony]